MARLAGCLVVLALAFSGCAGAAPMVAARTATPAATSSGSPPVLLGDVEVAPPERDDSPALLARLRARQRQSVKLLRDAAAAPRSEAGGCVFARPTMAGPPPPKAWLPEPPAQVEAVMLGRQVQVDVTLPPAASSAACRVAGLTIVVFSGEGGTTTYNNVGGIENYSLLFGRGRLLGRTVRVVGRIPYGGTPPYHLSVNTQTVQGLRSTYVDQTLTCPDGGSCLSEGRPPARPGLPRPLLPTRGITAQSLERSLLQVLAGEPPLWVKPTGATCTTASACRVEFYDSVARARLLLRYAVEGEQRPGCWLAMVTTSRTIPARAQVTSPSAARRLGGCVSWAG